MRLQRLRLSHFRAHTASEVEFAPGVNLLVGSNGAGKTNVLEAINYLAFGKSFLTTQDQIVLRRGDPFFEVRGDLAADDGATSNIRVAYVPSDGKRIFANGATLERLIDVVGRLPLVVISPSDYLLTAGGPEDRRRFMDGTLSLSRPAYLADLLRYRRALKQRNVLLSSAKFRGGPDPGTLEAYSEELVQLGSRIIHARRLFLIDFKKYLGQAYSALLEVGEQPSMSYVTLEEESELDDVERIQTVFRERLFRTKRREVQLGRTMAGPHRDEILLRLSGFEVRPYASQGQHRTFGLALQLARFFFLQDRLEESPILLLDDVFGVLDPARSDVVMELLMSDAVGQSLITAARADPFLSRGLPMAAGHAVFEVNEGTIRPA
jgi:DNA replication and repair protein RecF